MIEGIRHIIFDLGGVLLNIDYSLTEQAFKNCGIENFDQIYSQLKQEKFFDDLETGKITSGEFTQSIQQIAAHEISEEQIITAWNAMLLDLPVKRLQLLQQLRNHYDLILLSNTNEIHEAAFNKITQQAHGTLIGAFFDKIYFSHRVGMRKPDKEIFERILNDTGFKPQETLFIDDSPQHIKSAEMLGIQTIFLEKGMTIEDHIFKPKNQDLTSS